MSSAIARNIFRMFSACCSSWLWVLNLDSLVTPSTSCATSGPNRSSMSARREVGVLGDVVEEGRRDGDGIDADVGEDLRGGQRVGDVRLAGDPSLAVVGLLRRTRRPRGGRSGRPEGSGAPANRGRAGSSTPASATRGCRPAVVPPPRVSAASGGTSGGTAAGSAAAAGSTAGAGLVAVACASGPDGSIDICIESTSQIPRSRPCNPDRPS